MERLKVRYHLLHDNHLIYCEDLLSQEIMDTATSIFQVKELYCKEKGYDPKEILEWVVGDEETS